jgi:hypothetical protein
MDSIDDLIRNPEAFGFCTFDQFRANRQHWNERFQGRKDEEVTAIDRGLALGCEQRYYIDCAGSGTVRLDSLEQGERIASDMGMDLHRDFLVRPQLRQDMTTRRGFYNEVTFVPKERVARACA